MTNNFSIGSFINFQLWTEAKKLLDFQISQIDKNRHYNTFSLFYYKNLNTSETKQCGEEDYFNSKIANNLFFALETEFFHYKIAKPKDGLGLRNYNVFSYPMMILYYSVGLYLLKISQEWIDKTKSNYSDIHSFYGGNIKFKGDDLQFSKKTIYYAEFYKKFRNLLRKDVEEILDIQSVKEKTIVLKLDIQNYFDNIIINNLLKFIYQKIKPGVREKFKFKEEIIEQIIFFFDFIMYCQKGIPQSDNNIISGFLGYLYLLFCDLTINDIINSHSNSLTKHKIFRYVDDTYILLEFKKDIDHTNRNSIAQHIASNIADKMYYDFQLRLNQKTGLYDLQYPEHQNFLLKELKRTSPEYPIANDDKSQSPQDKFDAIIRELNTINKSNKYISCQPIESIQKEILKDVYDSGVQNIFNKPENKIKLNSTLHNFNFDLVKLSPKELIIILMKNCAIKKEFREFLNNKADVSIRDINVTLEYLCQVSFSDKELLETLSKTEYFRKLYHIFKAKTIYSKEPGYYKLSENKIKIIANQHNIIEQIILRLINERKAYYSVALSHLLNEVHAICWFLDAPDNKEYKAENAYKYLISKKIPHGICDSIANLFDRRNRNIISHPNSNHYLAWKVTIQEYEQYKECVAKSLMVILE